MEQKGPCSYLLLGTTVGSWAPLLPRMGGGLSGYHSCQGFTLQIWGFCWVGPMIDFKLVALGLCVQAIQASEQQTSEHLPRNLDLFWRKVCLLFLPSSWASPFSTIEDNCSLIESLPEIICLPHTSNSVHVYFSFYHFLILSTP